MPTSPYVPHSEESCKLGSSCHSLTGRADTSEMGWSSTRWRGGLRVSARPAPGEMPVFLGSVAGLTIDISSDFAVNYLHRKRFLLHRNFFQFSCLPEPRTAKPDPRHT